jgi:hypothetical protein
VRIKPRTYWRLVCTGMVFGNLVVRDPDWYNYLAAILNMGALVLNEKRRIG